MLKIGLESKKEVISPGEILGEDIASEVKIKALRPLKELAQYYCERDIAQIDQCMDDVMAMDEIVVLGTNPREIFCGKEKVYNLLLGDWKYWGQAHIDADASVLYQIGNALYFVSRGNVKLDIWRFVIPIKITGVLVEKDEKWYISKLQFVNEFNTNYIIFAWGSSIALIISIVMFIVTSIFHI